MQRQITVLVLVIATLAICALVYLNSLKSQKETGASVVESLSNSSDVNGFARATQVRQFTFPQDAGPHPEFQNEWWYYTGNLNDETGRHFGFQLTFFRRALSPKTSERKSNWATNQIYFAHFAVSDIQNRKFYPNARWSRGAMGLAGAEADPFRVWLEDWSAASRGKSIHLNASNGSVSINLYLTPTKLIALHGKKGLSQKSAERGNASYYYSQTRLNTKGNIVIKGERFEVQGLSWLDREWSTSALSKDQTGWDWFSLQLSDGREIMLYQLRLKNGGIDPYSSGSIIERNGTVRNIGVDNFQVEVLDTWESPETGIIYPCRWRIVIPAYDIVLVVIPHQHNQELPLDFTYWEGAVRIEGDGISGNGYVELTGYKQSEKTDLNYSNLVR
ncbi:MAG TPA: lipocalin-like domain-containing protein [Thermodesulfobacteriota bacterium]|nr:lipocalin-like domain-containing protein [Thermodesulfobacteriota bacterium]